MPLAPPSTRKTLAQFLAEDGCAPSADNGLHALVLDVALACKRIAKTIAFGELAGLLGNHVGHAGDVQNIQGETQKKLDVLANEEFIRCTEWGGQLAGMASEELEQPYAIPGAYAKGPYLLVFDPLDGSSNIDANLSVGSIFSVLKAPADLARGHRPVADADFFQPGSQQLAAGYAVYGPTTMLVLTLGNGVHGFTLDPHVGDFLLTHPAMRIPRETHEFAINASNARFWPAPVQRYVDECLAGQTGPRGKDFNMRWVASLVAEAHRILVRGGVFLYPRDHKDTSKPGRLRLLYEANPIGMLVEQAQGRCSTGTMPMHSVLPEALHQRIGLVFGSASEVERIEAYHAEHHGDGQAPAPALPA